MILEAMTGAQEATVRIVEAVAVVIAGVQAWRAKVHAKVSAQQVANDHPTNLREDLDKVLQAVAEARQDFQSGLRGLGHQLGEVRRDMDADRRMVDGRLSRLEDRRR